MPRLLIAFTLMLLAIPAAASASSNQISIMQDDATFLGYDTSKDAESAMAEARYLGVDVVRAFVSWSKVSPAPTGKRVPAGFDPSDPDSPGYDWTEYDRFVANAGANGLKVFLTMSPPIPHWASENPNFCPHRIGGYKSLGKDCYWKPRPKLFGQFVAAVAKRYRGRVSIYSMYNEPNLEHYLYPQPGIGSGGPVDVAARRYRSLWYEGYKAIRANDPARRKKVLFGETAAISSPLDTLYAALCLDENGTPFRGARKRKQGCSKPRRLPIGGIAVHPYAKDAVGSVFTKTATRDSHPMAYANRLHKVLDQAVKYGRIPRGKGIWNTEFGFQSNPPDRVRGLSLAKQAQRLNEAERLFASDSRMRSFSQFELYDAPEVASQDIYNTGLRFIRGGIKPSYNAFRMPIVASRYSESLVEVWGQVRPVKRRVRPRVYTVRNGNRRLIARPGTNRAGYFRFFVRRKGATKLRFQSQFQLRPAEYVTPGEAVLRSRVATVGRRIRYLKSPPGP